MQAKTAAQSRITKGEKGGVCRGRPLLHPSLACILRDSANAERDVILASGEQAGIMAQRKKRATARRGKSAARGKARKTSKSARGRAANGTVATSKQRKSLANAKPKWPALACTRFG